MFNRISSKLVGTYSTARVLLKSSDGQELLKSNEEVLQRWAEHFNNLLNVDRSADVEHVTSIPQLPIATELDEPLSRDEVALAIKQQWNKRAVGIDFMPGELLNYAGDVLNSRLWEHFNLIWQKELVPHS